MKTQSEPIEWEFWRHMPALLWQASALSLNINPDNLKHHPQGWMARTGNEPLFTRESFPNDATIAKFDRRLRLLCEHYLSEHFTDVKNSRGGDPHLAKVSLRDFAAWGLNVGFNDMPHELEAMATRGDKPTVRDDGLVRLDALLLELSTQLVAENSAIEKNSIKASVAAAVLAHGSQPLEHMQWMSDQGEITLLGVISRIAPPKPPKIEHIPDWLLSKADAEKVRAKLRAFSVDNKITEPAAAKSESQETSEVSRTSADGEPKLIKGINKRNNVEAWVIWQANQLKVEHRTGRALAAAICSIAQRWQYKSERSDLTESSIIRMLPKGITGGRSKPRPNKKK